MRTGFQTQAEAARRLTWFLLLLLGVALMVALYYVKTRAQSARADANQLARQIHNEKAAISVLRAEIAHLESPDRIKRLSEVQLGLAPTLTDQMLTVDDIAVRFPLRDGIAPKALPLAAQGGASHD